MSCRKCRRWHFRDPKFKNFLGVFPQVWGTFGALTFFSFKISCCAADYWHLIAYEINTQGWKKRLGLEGVRGGGGGAFWKLLLPRGGTIFICNYFGGFKFWYTTLLKTPATVWELINDQSLTKGVTKHASWIESKTLGNISQTADLNRRVYNIASCVQEMQMWHVNCNNIIILYCLENYPKNWSRLTCNVLGGV